MSESIAPLLNGQRDGSSSDHAEGSNNGEGSSRKRARKGPIAGTSSSSTIACTECRKRKSRCDRENPCGTCVRRGVAHLCQPEVRRFPPSVMDIRQTVQALQTRLQAVEAFLGSKLDFQQSDVLEPQIETQKGKAANRTLQEADNAGASDSLVPPSTGQEEAEIAYFLTGTASLRDFDILPDASMSESNGVVNAAEAYTHTTNTKTGTIIQPIRHPPTAWQRQLFSSLLSSVPPASQARRLTLLYFRHQEWQIHAVSRTQMLQEIDELETLQNEGRLEEVDPAWLALLFQLMSFGLVTSYTIDEVDYTDDVYDAVRTQVQLSQRCLAAADWAEVPSVRVIQTLVVHGWWAQHTDADANLFEASAAAGQSSRMKAGVAFLHCQALRLDKLGHKESTMPRLDPALPHEASGYRRQMGLRIWHSFQFLESLSGHLHALPGTFSSEHPALCRDKDLGASLMPPIVTLDEEPDVVHLHIGLSNVKARRDYLLVKEKGSITFDEADKLEASCIPDLADITAAIMRMSDEKVPPCFGTREGYIQALRIIKGAAILRIRRLALKSISDPFSPSARIYLGRVQEAAAALVRLLTSPTHQRIVRKFPVSPLYLLNASVTLTVALCKETSSTQRDLITGLIKDAIDTLTGEGLQSRNSAIKANSEKAILTLDKLIHFLLYHRGANTNEQDRESSSRQYLAKLATKIRHASTGLNHPAILSQVPQGHEDIPVRSLDESIGNDGSLSASLHIPHDYSNATPSMQEFGAMWGWPMEGYGEAQVGELTDFTNWSLLQYLEDGS